MLKKIGIPLVLIVVLFGSVVILASMNTKDEVTELTILWAQWPPSGYLQQIGNEYEAQTGIAVTVVQQDWGSYFDRVTSEWAAGGDSFDMVLGDSQWIGLGVTEGHYVDMTGFLTGNGIAESVTPAALQHFAEYPTGSGRYYAYPTQGDAVGWAYRMDLWEHPNNQAAFEEQYGYPLAVPETWEQLRDMAEFFTRPDEGLYGSAIYTGEAYDTITMGFESILFSYGADWRDENNNVFGVVNSPEAIAALELYKELYSFAPPDMDDAYFDSLNETFVNGQAAMIMNFFTFIPVLLNPEINPYAGLTGFFAMPSGPGGDRHTALGGQGLSVNAAISKERQQAALNFIEWFAQEDVQKSWAELGGHTSNSAVLESPEYAEIAPFNPALAESMTILKDFWNIPEHGQLLESTQRHLHDYIVGNEGTAEETLNSLAIEQNQILIEAGIIEE